MRSVVTYYCELCNTGYNSAVEAEACEAKGSGAVYPVGMMWRVKLGEFVGRRAVEHAETLTYAIILEKPDSTGHARSYWQWATTDGRDASTRRGDTIGEYTPGVCKKLDKPFVPSRAQPPDPNLLSFWRMVDALRAAGIEPSVWDGECAAAFVVRTNAGPSPLSAE